ncbi:hypothetical protein [Nocardioides sp. B-3]|uniref:hypothetical protein n=1 Tax=Nocardioides sp. B-3 TaxID=2895565 RepID=UPI0021522501|nr:hypothetical protein [Nocardioides sp. B-3]UUZ61899.1 hypothetical protein LP418_17630 [Nocardioides sp. B-3]
MRDFGKVAQTLTQFVTFSVPMMYPFTLVQGPLRVSPLPPTTSTTRWPRPCC